MPIYEYKCENGHVFDAIQRMTDEPLTECPACGGRLRKVFSAVGVVFKGSGFYRTDSRAAASSSEAKADSKPATEKKPKPAATGSGIPAKAAASS